MANISQQALAQLKDIHLPEAIGLWPLAPGWYLLGLLVIGIVTIIAYSIRTRQKLGQPKREALRQLAKFKHLYEQDGNSPLAAARISELLKRVALVYFPRQRVASLQGLSWVGFLTDTGKNLNFEQVQNDLLALPYYPVEHEASKNADLSTLFTLSSMWIKQRRKPCLN